VTPTRSFRRLDQQTGGRIGRTPSCEQGPARMPMFNSCSDWKVPDNDQKEKEGDFAGNLSHSAGLTSRFPVMPGWRRAGSCAGSG